MQYPLSSKLGTNFADKRQSLGQYSSLVGWGHEVSVFIINNNITFCTTYINTAKSWIAQQSLERATVCF
jgi:hypothetical protein